MSIRIWLLMVMIVGFFEFCTNSNKPNISSIIIVEKIQLKDSLTLFLYNKAGLLHVESETQLAIAKDYCDIFKMDTVTIGQTPSYAVIDSVVGDKIYLCSDHPIEVKFPTKHYHFIYNKLDILNYKRHWMNVDVSEVDCK